MRKLIQSEGRTIPTVIVISVLSSLIMLCAVGVYRFTAGGGSRASRATDYAEPTPEGIADEIHPSEAAGAFCESVERTFSLL